MTKYVKKPIPVDAHFLDSTDISTYPSWLLNNIDQGNLQQVAGILNEMRVKTLEGWLSTQIGKCYIVKGVQGEIYPVEKEIFESTYDKVVEVET